MSRPIGLAQNLVGFPVAPCCASKRQTRKKYSYTVQTSGRLDSALPEHSEVVIWPFKGNGNGSTTDLQHVAFKGVTGPHEGPKDEQVPPYRRPCNWKEADGAVCGHACDPEHPKSPYCAEHRARARSDSQRRSRERKKAAADLLGVLKAPRRHTFVGGTYTGPLGVALSPEAAAITREQYGALLTALTAARTNTNGFTARKSASADSVYILDQLRDLAEAVEGLNDSLGAALFGRRLGKQ